MRRRCGFPSAAFHTHEQYEMTSQQIGFAVIGIGSWGEMMAHQIHGIDGLELVGVFDASPQRTQSVSMELQTRAFRSVDEALTCDDVQAVAVVVPNDLHAPLALEVLSAGKHLLLEKPMALTVADAEAVEAEARQRSLVLMLDHIQRFFPPLVEIKKLVESGTLGAIHGVSASRRDLLIRTKAWLQQRQHVGGLLYQSACHEFDMLRWYCGDVAEILSFAAPRRLAPEPLDFPDLIVSQLRFRSGAVGQVFNCMTDPLTGYDGVITGSHGVAGYDLYGGRLRWRLRGQEPQEMSWEPADQWSASPAVAQGNQPLGEVAALRALLQNFRNVILGVAEPVVTGSDGVRSIEIAQAGYISMVEKRPVGLPLSEPDRSRPAYLELPVPETVS